MRSEMIWMVALCGVLASGGCPGEPADDDDAGDDDVGDDDTEGDDDAGDDDTAADDDAGDDDTGDECLGSEYGEPGCPACDGAMGMIEPVQPCTAADPCDKDELLATYVTAGVTLIDVPADLAECSTGPLGKYYGRPVYADGPPRTWTDEDGVERSWCEYRPPGTSDVSPRPLVIDVHGSGGAAQSVYDTTSLRTKAIDHDLSGDPARPGFVLVATQGRYLHWPTEMAQSGSKHDSYHRDLATPSTNRDINFVDHIVDSLAAEGVIDPDRIYITGWSNGARFSALYGVARHEGATPGGHHVAAVTVYSGGDPFENIRDGWEPSCTADPYPTSAVPFHMVSRSCDAVACDQDQYDAFAALGLLPTPGNCAETWIETLGTVIGSPSVEWRRINGIGQPVQFCNPPALCDELFATLNHLHWPDGVADESGIDYEPEMLDFLAVHPL